MKQARGEAGESLVEITISIVLIGLVMSALFAGFATAARASKTHRDVTTADFVLRGYAEAIKQAVRSDCAGASGTPTVSYTAPSGFTATASPAISSCPPKLLVSQVAPLAATTLTVSWNGGAQSRSMPIALRSP